MSKARGVFAHIQCDGVHPARGTRPHRGDTTRHTSSSTDDAALRVRRGHTSSVRGPASAYHEHTTTNSTLPRTSLPLAVLYYEREEEARSASTRRRSGVLGGPVFVRLEKVGPSLPLAGSDSPEPLAFPHGARRGGPCLRGACVPVLPDPVPRPPGPAPPRDRAIWHPPYPSRMCAQGGLPSRTKAWLVSLYDVALRRQHIAPWRDQSRFLTSSRPSVGRCVPPR